MMSSTSDSSNKKFQCSLLPIKAGCLSSESKSAKNSESANFAFLFIFMFVIVFPGMTVANFPRERSEHASSRMNVKDDRKQLYPRVNLVVISIPELLGEEKAALQKRSATEARILPRHEHVCETIIRTDYRPRQGVGENGTLIEIQQDEERQFMATFIECENGKRESCYGIDNKIFTSECATLYELRPAGIRLEGSTEPFFDGFIRVPITCQCRLRRKLGGILSTQLL